MANCSYCGQDQRKENKQCPYNLTAHAQFVSSCSGFTPPMRSRIEDDDTGNVMGPMVGAMIAEAVVEASVPSADTDSGTFEGFAGGDSGGGGATDTWESSSNDSSSSYDSSSSGGGDSF